MSDIFYEDVKVDSKMIEEVEKNLEIKSNVPLNYLPIEYTTLGRFDCPAKLHFRDFLFDESMKLGLSTSETALNNIIKILNKACFEKFDCQKMHEKELEETLLNLFFNFWGKQIEKAFPFTEEELQEYSEQDIKSLGYVNIDFSMIKTDTIDPKIKKHIAIEYKGITYTFRFPQVGAILKAQEYVATKFREQYQSIVSIENKLKKKLVLTKEEQDTYSDYLEDSSLTLLMATQAQNIVSIDNEEFITFEDQLKAYPRIGTQLWGKYAEELSKIKFGVNNLIKVKHPMTNKPVERRFLFQFLDFIPGNGVQDSSGFTVSFRD